MTVKIPTLTPKGFVSAVADKADTAMLNFYVSEYSQTNMFRGSNKPLAYLVQQYGTSADAMRSALDNELHTYLNRLFDYALITVTASEADSSISLRLDVMIREGDKEYSFGHEIKTANSKIVDIIDLNNTGSLLSKAPAILNS